MQKAIDVKTISYFHVNKNHFQESGLTLSLVLKVRIFEQAIDICDELTEFSFHFFTSPDFIDKFALKSIHVWIELKRKPST